MNYSGSSRHLLKNSRSAILAAIEIYNKPSFLYREECFIILLLNAWELLLKAIISKNGGSIYYRKKRNEPYRTLSMTDAFAKADKFFPKKIQALPLRGNLGLLSTYRDNAVHFYNESEFGVIIYSLSQTSILNFKDLLLEIFGKNIADDIYWQLMPLGLKPPIDPINYISRSQKDHSLNNMAVKQFLDNLASNIVEIEKVGADKDRLMTIFNISLQTVKKIDSADLVVGIDGAIGSVDGPLVITKISDPNMTHPSRQKQVVKQIGNLHGKVFTAYTFQAVCSKLKLKDNPQYCWKSVEGELTRYSNDIVGLIKKLSEKEISEALDDYRNRLNKK